MFSLDNHPRKYNLSFNDSLFSSFTGFSGLPYATRHWELSKIDSFWGHRSLALLEAIPIVGGAIALIERIVSMVHQHFFNHTVNTSQTAPPSLNGRAEALNKNASSEETTDLTRRAEAPSESVPSEETTDLTGRAEAPSESVPSEETTNRSWKPRALTFNAALQKMWENSKKAIKEHKKTPTAYAAFNQDALPSVESLLNWQPASPLKFEHSSAEKIGIRSTMEDSQFFKEIEQGAIVGVLDGHNGKQVTEFARDLFQENFSETLMRTGGNIHQTFEQLIHEIHEEVAKRPEWNAIGTTAVLCFIDKNNRHIYTATLGDSEANVYRNINGLLKSIPLSCVRDWSSKKDAARAAVALDDPSIATNWPNEPNPKRLRYPSPYAGINVSRSIGDVYLTGTNEKPGVTHKPKITVNRLKPGDILILSCDGLKDYVREDKIIATLNKLSDNKNVAATLANRAFEELNYVEEDKIINTVNNVSITSQNPAEMLANCAINKYGSRDNVTVVTVKISETSRGTGFEG